MILDCAYVGETDNKGNGMFTKAAIPAETIIEVAPVIVMTAEERLLLDKTLLHDYIFEWNPDGANMCCMAQGYVSVYNHSYTSNCEYFMSYDDNTILVKAIRDIDAGEELTINYNGDWDDTKPVWFEVNS